MANRDSLAQTAVSIVDLLVHLFPDPEDVPKDHQHRRPGWVFIAESNPCMQRCNVFRQELVDLAPRIEQQLRRAKIELRAQEIRDALQI